MGTAVTILWVCLSVRLAVSVQLGIHPIPHFSYRPHASFNWVVRSSWRNPLKKYFVLYLILGPWKVALFPLICCEKCLFTKAINQFSQNFAYKFFWGLGSLCSDQFKRNVFFLFLSFFFWTLNSFHIFSKLH